MNKNTPGRGARFLRPVLLTLLGVTLILSALSWLTFTTQSGDLGTPLKRLFSLTTGLCVTCQKQELDPGAPFVKAVADKALAAQLEDRAKKFAATNSIQVLSKDNKFDFILHAAGQELKLFETDASEEGLNKAQALLDQIIQAKIAEMAKGDSKVAFAVEGEVVDKQKTYGEDGVAKATETLILARSPRLDELWGVEAALEHSKPSNLARGNQQGIKFYFLKNSLYQGEVGYAYFVAKDKDGRPSIYVTPMTTDHLLPTEKDQALTWSKTLRLPANGVFFDTIETLLLHELAHNHQDRMGWEDNGGAKVGEMAEQLGFHLIHDKKTGVRAFLVRVKPATATPATAPASSPANPASAPTSAPASSPANPASAPSASPADFEYYRLEVPRNPTKGKRWLKTNENGEYLSAAGLVVDSPDAAVALSNDEVRSRLVVSVPSNYFDTPIEVFAEGMKAFRMGGEARSVVLKIAPTVYKLVKEEDQKELNDVFGYYHVVTDRTMLKDGKETKAPRLDFLEPVMMRNWNDEIVPYGEDERKKLESFEKGN